jgi:hypothetical protein
MGRRRCTNCDNDTVGTTIYRCKNCSKIYCEDCLPKGQCGNCDEEWFPGVISALPFMPDNLDRVGEIEEDGEEDND